MTFVLSKMSGFSIEEKVHEFESKDSLRFQMKSFTRGRESSSINTSTVRLL